MTILRAIVRTVGELLLTAGLVIALFLGYLLGWQPHLDSGAQAQAVGRLEHDFATAGAVAPGSPFAVLRIPRLGGDWAKPVREGVGPEILAQGIGHYPGTAAPGAVGNAAYAGHRSGHGNPLLDIDQVVPGDDIVVETRDAYVVYRAVRHVIVSPTSIDVVAPVPQHPGARPTERWLTLTTCNPRWGNKQRYVVFARFERSYPRAAGLPAGLLGVPSVPAEH